MIKESRAGRQSICRHSFKACAHAYLKNLITDHHQKALMNKSHTSHGPKEPYIKMLTSLDGG